jgi:predicted nucleotidyltransferase
VSSSSSRWVIYNKKTTVRPDSNETDEKYLSTEVNEMLWDKLEEINDHDYEAITRHKEEILNKLANEFDGVEDIGFGGSHSRNTDVAGLSDVDVLVTLGELESGESSSQMLDQFAKTLKDRFPKTKISVGKMAVTIKFSDGIEIQVLPAFKYRDGYRISDPQSEGWITTFPERFCRELTEVNKKQSNMVIPIVKLAKYICRTREINVESYHLENMALNIFRQYAGERTLPRMLEHLFGQVKSMCLRLTKDPSGQSKYVDEELSISNRQQLAKDFKHVESDLKLAMMSKSLVMWRNLFNA